MLILFANNRFILMILTVYFSFPYNLAMEGVQMGALW